MRGFILFTILLFALTLEAPAQADSDPSAEDVIVAAGNEDDTGADESGEGPTDPAEGFILNCSTPATLPKGTLSFRDDMIVIMGLEYGLTESTQLKLWPLHPMILAGEGFLFLDVKQRILDRETKPLGIALTGGIAFSADHFAWKLPSLIAGLGNSDRSLNFNGSFYLDNDGNGYPQYMFGVDQRLSRKIKIGLEYAITDYSFLESDDDLQEVQMLGLGIRFFGARSTFTVSLSKLYGFENDDDPLTWLPWFTIYTHL